MRRRKLLQITACGRLLDSFPSWMSRVRVSSPAFGKSSASPPSFHHAAQALHGPLLLGDVSAMRTVLSKPGLWLLFAVTAIAALGPLRQAAADDEWAMPPTSGGTAADEQAAGEFYDRIRQSEWPAIAIQARTTGVGVGLIQTAYALIAFGLAGSKKNARGWLMHLAIPLLAGVAFWAYGFALGWGNWFNGPVPPGWYASLGRGPVRAEFRHRLRAGHR